MDVVNSKKLVQIVQYGKVDRYAHTLYSIGFKPLLRV